MKSKDNVQSVERAIDLLYCFSFQKPELSLNDFVIQTGLKRTTVFRLLSSLKNKGLIIKDEHSSTYKLGLPLLEMSQIVSENLDIRKEAIPIMENLAKKTNETVSLNLIQDLHRICVEKVEGTEDIRQFIRLGFPYPIIKGASGKLLLAYSSSNYVERVILNHQQEDILTEVFLEELKQIKNQGYAFSMNERVKGAYAISTPILGVRGVLHGGLSISGLSIRLNNKLKEDFIEDAIIAAQMISKKMGFNP
ncbi:IclR family transcriptional regulator [Calidifontibacillus oryziterrae]|uniref:IclR family transcriptional regulator n=1 Tax=Calidifontibacillus oryziterrae TaxID=1191699 RepID=UPI0002E8F652|nr:IclR family transcriptional regulator [Calidifontibacillus oryziterrae]